MKSHQFRAFVAIADSGSIRAAARYLGVSSAAVTKAVRDLEIEQKIALITRNANGVGFTEAGQAFLAHARLIVCEMRRAQEEIDARRGGGGGKLSVGVTPWLALSFLPETVSLFRKRMPEIQLEFHEGLLNVTIPRLRDGSLDFAIGRPLPDTLHTEFAHIPIVSTESAVVVRQNHPLAKARSFSELQDCEWVLNWETGSKEMIADGIFRRHGLSMPATIHLVHSFVVAIGLIMRTDMVSIFPWPLMESSLLRDNFRPLVLKEELDRTVSSVVSLRNVILSPAAECFLGCFKEVIRDGYQSQCSERRRLYQSLELVLPSK